MLRLLLTPRIRGAPVDPERALVQLCTRSKVQATIEINVTSAPPHHPDAPQAYGAEVIIRRAGSQLPIAVAGVPRVYAEAATARYHACRTTLACPHVAGRLAEAGQAPTAPPLPPRHPSRSPLGGFPPASALPSPPDSPSQLTTWPPTFMHVSEAELQALAAVSREAVAKASTLLELTSHAVPSCFAASIMLRLAAGQAEIAGCPARRAGESEQPSLSGTFPPSHAPSWKTAHRVRRAFRTAIHYLLRSVPPCPPDVPTFQWDNFARATSAASSACKEAHLDLEHHLRTTDPADDSDSSEASWATGPPAALVPPSRPGTPGAPPLREGAPPATPPPVSPFSLQPAAVHHRPPTPAASPISPPAIDLTQPHCRQI